MMSTFTRLYSRCRAKISREQRPHSASSSQNSGWKLKTNSQLQSGLLAKLPLEIRHLIYQHWISEFLGDLIHITLPYQPRPRRLYHVKCVAESSRDTGSSFSLAWIGHESCWLPLAERHEIVAQKQAYLPLLTTCQQM
jgi:hypothetical protein